MELARGGLSAKPSGRLIHYRSLGKSLEGGGGKDRFPYGGRSRSVCASMCVYACMCVYLWCGRSTDLSSLSARARTDQNSRIPELCSLFSSLYLCSGLGSLRSLLRLFCSVCFRGADGEKLRLNASVHEGVKLEKDGKTGKRENGRTGERGSGLLTCLRDARSLRVAPHRALDGWAWGKRDLTTAGLSAFSPPLCCS